MNYSLSEISNVCHGQIRGFSGDPTSLRFSSFSTDTRKDAPSSLFFALKGENFDAHEFLEKASLSGASALCVNKSFAERGKAPENIPILVVEDTLKAYQCLARHHRRRLSPKIIALTGSSGKTSTKEILAAILRSVLGEDRVLVTHGNTNNHVGVPYNLLRLEEKHEWAVIEMGTNHFGEISELAAIAEPDFGLVVSIGSAHLEYLIDTDGVAREKSAIFSRIPDWGAAVIPASCPGNTILLDACKNIRTCKFGDFQYPGNCDLRVKYISGDLRGTRFELFRPGDLTPARIEWKLPGRHQAMNAAAAVLTACTAGFEYEKAVQALSGGLELPGMRSKFVESGSVTWINDAYNANPDSMRAGLEWLSDAMEEEKKDGNLHLVLGDMLELGKGCVEEHAKIVSFALEKLPGAKMAVVGQIMNSALKTLGASHKIASFPDSVSAQNYRSSIKPGDIVYLKGSRGTALEKILPQ